MCHHYRQTGFWGVSMYLLEYNTVFEGLLLLDLPDGPVTLSITDLLFTEEFETLQE